MGMIIGAHIIMGKYYRGFTGDSVVKNPPVNAGRSPGEGNSNPLQDSCLGNPMDRGAWWATVHGVSRVGLI